MKTKKAEKYGESYLRTVLCGCRRRYHKTIDDFHGDRNALLQDYALFMMNEAFEAYMVPLLHNSGLCLIDLCDIVKDFLIVSDDRLKQYVTDINALIDRVHAGVKTLDECSEIAAALELIKSNTDSGLLYLIDTWKNLTSVVANDGRGAG
jgi:hypothetical protein